MGWLPCKRLALSCDRTVVTITALARLAVTLICARRLPKNWSRMQVKLLNRRRWKTRLELANAMFDYLEIFPNRRRRHSALGWLTPMEFENRPSMTVA